MVSGVVVCLPFPLLLKLVLVVVDGWENDADRSRRFSEVADGSAIVDAGMRAERKSVYACGGVMGVLCSSSCLTFSRLPEGRGLSCISDGKVGDFDVFKGANEGFGDGDIALRSLQRNSRRAQKINVRI